MADILDAAQTNTPPPGDGLPLSEPPPPNTDSLVVPPPPPPPLPPEEPKQEEAKPAENIPQDIPEKPKKKSRLGVLLAGLLLLVITIPLLVVFVRQQIEIRSRATGGTFIGCTGTPPANCVVGGYTIKTCNLRDEANCKAVAKCGCTPTYSSPPITQPPVTQPPAPSPTTDQPCQKCTAGICSTTHIDNCKHSADKCQTLGSGSECGGTTPAPTTPAPTSKPACWYCDTQNKCAVNSFLGCDSNKDDPSCPKIVGIPCTSVTCTSLRGSCVNANYCYLPNKKTTPDCTGGDSCCYGTASTTTPAPTTPAPTSKPACWYCDTQNKCAVNSFWACDPYKDDPSCPKIVGIPCTSVTCKSLGGSCVNANYCYLPNKKTTPDCTGGDSCCYGTPPTTTPAPSNTCTTAGGKCQNTPSCSKLGLGIVNGGNGCNAGAGEICCSNTTPGTTGTPQTPTCIFDNRVSECVGPDRCDVPVGEMGWLDSSCTAGGTNTATCKLPYYCTSNGTCIKNGTCTPTGMAPINCHADTSCGNGPGPTSTPAPQCINLVAYKDGNALSASDLAALHVGDTITLALAPGGAATKVRFAVNPANPPLASDWHETTTKNANNQFIWNYTLANITSFTIKAQWFDGSAWH